MAKRFTGIGVVVVLAAIGGLAALGACNSSDDTADCGTLNTCCAQITNTTDKASCASVVSAGDATECATVQSEFEATSMCTVISGGGGATGCAGLTACCATLGTGEASCEAEVSESDGIDSTCSIFLTSYQSAGMCAATGTGTSGTGCAGLSTCCASVPQADQASCTELAGEGSDTVCSEELTAYTTAGYCGGTGTGTGTGGTGCSGLSSCCATLPAAEQAGCQGIVSAGSDTECSEELTAYMDADECGGGTGTGTGTGGTNCASLSSCCGSLPSADQASCDEIVSAGSDTECSEELTAYTSAGECGGGTGTGTGTGGCASLSSCCSTLSSTEQTGCDEIVSEGSDTTCSEELSAYMESGFCGG